MNRSHKLITVWVLALTAAAPLAAQATFEIPKPGKTDPSVFRPQPPPEAPKEQGEEKASALVYEGEPLMAGDNELSFTVPQTESPQQMVPQAAIRVRYGTQQQLGYSGPADNGEVEDYVMRVLAAQNDTLPRISSAPREIIEGDIGTKELIFNLSLSHASDQTVSVDFSTIDGTATSGLDYVAASGTAVFHPGETIAEIVVPIIGEYLFEADETFQLILENAVGATIGNPSTTGAVVWRISRDRCSSGAISPGSRVQRPSSARCSTDRP